MAIITDGPVTPSDGTVFVRSVPTPGDLTLNEIFPDDFSDATEIDFSTLTKRGNTARFRALDAPAHMTPRDQITTNRVGLLPLSGSKPVLGENELSRLYGLETGNSPLGPVARSIYDDLENSTLDILRRAELARGSVLSTGTLPLNEGGLNGVIDYGIPSGNKLTAPILWSNTANADIVTWLNTVRLAYIALNGYAPGGMLTSTPVVSYMQQNTILRSTLIQSVGQSYQGFAGLLPRAAVDAILESQQLPPILKVYDSRVDVDGTNTLVIPSNLVIVLPPANIPVGKTQWGPTVTAQKLVQTGDLTEEAPGIVGFVDRGSEFPYKERSIADSLMLPAAINANGIMILTVA